MSRTRYSIRVAGKVDPHVVSWLENVIDLLRQVPRGWRVRVVLERDDGPPDGVEN